jgi:DNA replication protein DnaC
MAIRSPTPGAPALFRDLHLARADGSLKKLFRRLNRIDVLVVDD